ncbi:MAG: phage major capsid protein [Anaerolineales bacterium]|nr:phage major capsid protein [Anaerolineales bacterium]
MTQTITLIDAVLKELYDGQELTDLTYDNRPFLAMVPKEGDFTGRSYPLPILFAGGTNVGSTFATAQGNGGYARYDSFLLTRTNYHGIARIDAESVLAAKQGPGAFIDGVKGEVDAVINKVSNDLEAYMFGVNGILGQLDSTLTVGASVTGTLLDTSAIVNFEVGDVLGSISTSGSSERATTAIVQRVDRDAGTIFVNTQWTSNFWLTSDYLVKAGSYALTPAGLGAWIPTTAPAVGGASFYGVDRSVDPVRLGGVRIDGSSLGTIIETLNKGVQRLVREGGKPDVCFMNPEDVERLLNEMGSNRMFTNVDTTSANILFKAIEVMTSNGAVKVVPAAKCPKGRCYLLTMKTWVLKSIGKPVDIQTFDGLRAQRVYNADSLEVRVAFRGALGCKAPGWNAVLTLPTA